MAKKSQSEIEFDFFDIDINRLDEEWIHQPKMYFEYSEELTRAKEELERCKAQLEIAGDELKEVRARLDLRIRKNPKKFFGVEINATEAAVSNRILVHPKYAIAKAKIYQLTEQLILANKKVSTFYSAIHALDHRKSALERLVSLHGQTYFSVPKASGEDAKEVLEEIQNRGRRRHSLKGKKEGRTR